MTSVRLYIVAGTTISASFHQRSVPYSFVSSDAVPNIFPGTMVKFGEFKLLYDYRKDAKDVLQKYALLKDKLSDGTEELRFKPENTFPDDQVYYKCANLAYKKTSADVLKELKGGLIKGGKWDLLNFYEGSKGGSALLLLNAEAEQLMLAYRGTSITSVSDIMADVKIGLNKDSPYFDVAATIVADVRNVVEDFNGRVQLFITGHSLGGFLAQIATYVVKHRRVKDKALVELAPTDLEIHPKTVVFDSPPCMDQIIDASGFNPFEISHFNLDITTYVNGQNAINGMIGGRRPHLGTILWVKTEEPEPEKKGWGTRLWDWIKNKNPIKGHTLIHFSEVGRTEKELVDNLTDWKVRKYDPSVRPHTMFSLRELDCLRVLPFVEFLENKQVDVKFKMDQIHIRLLFGVEADTFVPKLRTLFREGREYFEGVPKKVSDFFWAGMGNVLEMLDFQFDSVDVELEKSLVDKIENAKGDICIKHTGSWQDKILLAKILQNSIDSFFYIEYQMFAKMDAMIRDPFLSRFNGTLALLVRDNVELNAQDLKKLTKNCRFLIISSKSVEGMTEVFALDKLCFCNINAEGRKRALEEQEVMFFGEKMTLNKLGINSKEKMSYLEMLDFDLDDDTEAKTGFHLHFYQPQDVSPVQREVKVFNISDFISTQITSRMEEHVGILLYGDAGMGKSTYLRMLREAMQQTVAAQGFWVAKLNLPDCREYMDRFNQKTQRDLILGKPNPVQNPVKLNVMELIRMFAIPKDCNDFEKNVLMNLWSQKKAFLLMDAYDEMCPTYRELTDHLITDLRDNGYNFIVTTRTLEAGNLMLHENGFITKTFRLLPFDKHQMKGFFTKFFNSREKEPNEEAAKIKAETLLANLKTTPIGNEFWGVPLQAVLVAKMFEDTTIDFDVFNNLAELYHAFLDSRLDKNIEKNMGVSKFAGSSMFEETKKELVDYLRLAGAQQVLGIKLLDTKYRQQKLKKLAKGINASGIAIVLKEGQSWEVTFSSSSFAEYLAAVYVVDIIKGPQLVKILPDLLAEPKFRFTRRFINDLIGVREMRLPSDQFEGVELRERLEELRTKILQNLLAENLSNLYELLKILVHFNLNEELPSKTVYVPHEMVPKQISPGVSRVEEEQIKPLKHALILALENGDEDFVIQLLKDSKIQVSCLLAKHFHTALDLCAKRNFMKLAKFLIDSKLENCSDAQDSSKYDQLIEEALKSVKASQEFVDYLQKSDAGQKSSHVPLVD